MIPKPADAAASLVGGLIVVVASAVLAVVGLILGVAWIVRHLSP